jgi:hypothetical protein
MNTRKGSLIGVLVAGLVLASCCVVQRREALEQPENSTGFASLEAPQVSVRTDRRRYAPADPISVTIENSLNGPIRYMNGCSLHLCHYLGDEWLCEMKECHSPTIVLEPGGSVEVRHHASAAVGSSVRYRLDYQVMPHDAPATAYSNDFTITQASMASQAVVASDALIQFFEIVESKDFHRMARIGEEVFRQGLTMPDHAKLFAGFPSSEVERSRIRYVLYSFRGEASAGEVYLILERDSGEIVEFNSFEALFAVTPNHSTSPIQPDGMR